MKKTSFGIRVMGLTLAVAPRVASKDQRGAGARARRVYLRPPDRLERPARWWDGATGIRDGR